MVATPAGGRSTSGTESRSSPIRFFDLANSQIDRTTALPEGKVNLKTEYSAAGPMDQGGTLRLFVNGKPAGEGKIHWRLSGKSGGNGFALVLDPGRRAAYRRSVRTLVILLATAGGVGYVPIASGTLGSMVAVPFLPGLAALRSGAPLAYAAIVAVVIAVAIWSAGRAEAIFGGKDHSRIVIDEVAGQVVAGAFVPGTWTAAALAFFLFRLFDVLKPWPADLFDRQVPGGVGVVGDDLIAGAYAGAAAWLTLRLV